MCQAPRRLRCVNEEVGHLPLLGFAEETGTERGGNLPEVTQRRSWGSDPSSLAPQSACRTTAPTLPRSHQAHPPQLPTHICRPPRACAQRDRQGYLPWKILLQLVLSAGLLSVFINSLDKYLYVMARAAACWGGQMRSLCFLQHVDGGRREGEGGRRGAWGMGRWCNESCRALGVWRAG